jgi:hypothetical protein
MASDTLTTPAEPPAEPGQAGQATKPACDLSDIDAGDAFRLVLRVATTLDHAGQQGRGTTYWDRAYPLRDYSRALTIAREYVEVVV